MEFNDVVTLRRSVRKYIDEPVPKEVVAKAVADACLAPSSSNLQPWHFYWVDSQDKKKKLAELCFNQSAARTAPGLLVVTSSTRIWKKHSLEIIKHAESVNAPTKMFSNYYKKLIPFLYTHDPIGILSIIRWIGLNFIGMYRPIFRGPISLSDLELVTMKSTALACENLMLSIVNQGYSCCPMEGFDEWRVKRFLRLPRGSRIAMVISIGKPANDGVFIEQFRVPTESVFTQL